MIGDILFNDDVKITLNSNKHLIIKNFKELKSISHFNDVREIQKVDYLEMDIHTVRNLELFETIRLKDRTYSLIWLLDKCKTAMGSRKLKSFLG